jgi:TonB-like protein
MSFALEIFLGVTIAVTLLGCDRPAAVRRELPRAIPVSVLADSGGSAPLRVTLPSATGALSAPGSGPGRPAGVWLDRVTPVSHPAQPPLPEAAPDTSPPPPTPAGLEASDRLQPPIPRAVGVLRVPRGRRGGRVELDVLVDQRGQVVEARWAGGDSDSARVRAATECAEAMTFYPALLRGRPVEVWCRQRFEFGP